MKRYIAAFVLVLAALAAAPAFADITNEELLREYRDTLRQIELERQALADERAWMEEDRARREFDDRVYEELAAIVDRSFARLNDQEAALKREIELLRREQERFDAQTRVRVRRYTIKDPLIKRDLEIKIHRYWYLD